MLSIIPFQAIHVYYPKVEPGQISLTVINNTSIDLKPKPRN